MKSQDWQDFREVRMTYKQGQGRREMLEIFSNAHRPPFRTGASVWPWKGVVVMGNDH